MKVLILNCSLKRSLERSNTGALLDVVDTARRQAGVETAMMREDGAHHVIRETCGALIDIGYTIPLQAWTDWNKGPGRGPS